MTPKKKERVQLTRTFHDYDESVMQNTLKNGVGLFQQLANQYKIASEKKKQSNKTFGETTPFQYSERKK